MIKKAVLLFGLGFSSALSGNEMIPFPMQWEGAPRGIFDLRNTLEAPAGVHGWIGVEDGTYVLNGERLKFYGVNVGAAACFPSAEDAAAIADRLARCGFNVVRFHHMDNPWTLSLIDPSDGTSSQLHAGHLDRLDRFIAELKAVGIYSNLNLLCSRRFRAADGLAPGVDRMDWKDTHVLGFFDDGARNLQKAFAQALLQHVNPYTGLAYFEDPAIAVVEINNENGLLHQWHSGLLDRLPPHYERLLRVRWNAWLAQKYGSSEGLLDAWTVAVEPIGAELLSSSSGMGPQSGWILETHERAQASLTAAQRDAATPGVRISVSRAGSQGWHVQFTHPRLDLEAGRLYTVGFWIRGDSVRALPFGVMQAHEPWANLGYQATLSLKPEWQWFEATFRLSASDSNARLNLGGMGNQVGWVEIAGVTLRPGGTLGGLKQGESLEDGTIRLIRTGDTGGDARMRDGFTFLRELEIDYWNDMEAFVRALGYRGLTWGTTIMNSSPHMQQAYASTDSHAYWQHPQFHGTAWDPVNWSVPNVSMVADPEGGVIPNLAWQRVKGKPHNVTEYMHPSPNTFSSEAPLFAAAYGALQDWDGIYFFQYGSAQDDWDRDTFNGYFDMDRHPSKLANAILGSLLFRHSLVRPAEQTYAAPFGFQRELELMIERGGAWNVGDGRHLDLAAQLPLLHRFELDLSPAASPLPEPDPASGIPATSSSIPATSFVSTDPATSVSDTGELRWHHAPAHEAVVLLDAPRAKGVWGFQNGRIWELGPLRFHAQPTRQNWCTLVVLLTEGVGFAELEAGGRGMIVCTGDIENTNMGWTSAERESVGDQWGQGPVLLEKVQGDLSFPVEPDRLTVWALHPSGDRSTALPVREQGSGSRVQLGGESGSLWYEFEIRAR